MDSPERRFVSLKEAADLLGVHYMTAYRYVRHGQLEAHKEGGIWVVAVDDLLLFQSKQNDSKKPLIQTSQMIQDVRSSIWRDRLEACLLAGDGSGSWSVLEAAIDSGAEFVDVYLDILAPAMAAIGERWHAGKLEIYVEHRATGIATRLVARLGAKSAHRGRTRGVVLLGAPSGEHHSLAISILADVVRLARFEVHDLGADLPNETFLSAVHHSNGILAIGISANADESRSAVRDLIVQLRNVIDQDVRVFVGGRAINSMAEAHQLGADEWALDARSFVVALDRILKDK